MRQRALLLINRHARRGQKELVSAIQQLQSLGLELLEESTEHPQALSDTIRRYRDRVDLVIVGGGDGTLNATIAGLVETQLPLCVLPLGTANDLARTLNIPLTLPEACQLAVTGKVQRIDLGQVNGKYFFNVASLGLSVQITRRLNKETKKRWGVLAYAVTALQVLWRSRPFGAEICLNEKLTRVKTVQIAVGNGRYYGGGMTIVEDATISDERLDLYSLEIEHWWQIVALLPALRQGKQAKQSGVRVLQGKEFQVKTPYPRPINADGEILTSTPAHFQVVPKALSVLVPNPEL